MYRNDRSFKPSYLGSHRSSGSYGNERPSTYTESFSSGYIGGSQEGCGGCKRGLGRIQL